MVKSYDLADLSNNRHFGPLTGSFSVRFSDHHLNTPPSDNLTQIYHSNTRLVWYSYGCCISGIWISSIQIPTVFRSWLQLLTSNGLWFYCFRNLNVRYSDHKFNYSNHLNTREYGCPVFKWLSHMTCQTIQIPNIFDLNQAFFQSDFQTTIQTQDHLTTGHKTTIWIPDLSSIQMVTVQFNVTRRRRG